MEDLKQRVEESINVMNSAISSFGYLHIDEAKGKELVGLFEELAEREAKLVEALKPFAAVGRLKSITRHPDSGLWSHQAGSQDEGHVYTRITSADCILAEATLTELGIANKGEV